MSTGIPQPSDADKAIDLAVTYERCLDKSGGVKPAIIRRCFAAEQELAAERAKVAMLREALGVAECVIGISDMSNCSGHRTVLAALNAATEPKKE